MDIGSFLFRAMEPSEISSALALCGMLKCDLGEISLSLSLSQEDNLILLLKALRFLHRTFIRL